ncbi:response regulator transcription factor [Dyadobacter jiangsuensis]|uniref:LuxR family two component transcriptional regulator n=1 Tax=Dyadobacter jiangsuensis TaxID=1591085 RepID=A0A2P8G0F7_9BACT|nr:response regulator transcription factor [Dyadobacter jiangsuensis]PSL27463.1 LuxR family two component transcriptional regulator [Dyadobacter jiangsuensis]
MMLIGTTNSIKVALADDHELLRSGLAELVRKLGFHVLFESGNGRELISQLNGDDLPDIVLMDINMPQMDGFDTTRWLKINYPTVKVIALSMYDDEGAIIQMLNNGARGYLLKSGDADELKHALKNVYFNGYHSSEKVTRTFFRANQSDQDAGKVSKLNEREIEFLKLASSEMTYKEIADRMHVSPRTVDGYREALFERLAVKSRIGLVIFAIKNRIVIV